MIDRQVISARLLSLSRCVERVEKRRPGQLSELLSDFDTQDILSVNLQRAVQLCVDVGSYLLTELCESVPSTMAEVFTSLAGHQVISPSLAQDLGRAVGFRNVSVHEYDDIDWNIVFDISHNHLDEFRDFAAAVDAFMER